MLRPSQGPSAELLGNPAGAGMTMKLRPSDGAVMMVPESLLAFVDEVK
jgi:hypothetical protein